MPGKNRMIVGSKPLFRLAVEAAIESRYFDAVYLSTDDPELASMASEIGGLTILDRPSELAVDSARAQDVVLHHLAQLEADYDVAALLMPTTPFRRAVHIREALDLMEREQADSVVSVVEYTMNPGLAMALEGHRIRPWGGGDHYEWAREDAYIPAFHPNGCVFAASRRLLEERRTFVGPQAVAYVMDRRSSVDIDTPEDLALARALATSGRE